MHLVIFREHSFLKSSAAFQSEEHRRGIFYKHYKSFFTSITNLFFHKHRKSFLHKHYKLFSLNFIPLCKGIKVFFTSSASITSRAIFLSVDVKVFRYFQCYLGHIILVLRNIQPYKPRLKYKVSIKRLQLGYYSNYMKKMPYIQRLKLWQFTCFLFTFLKIYWCKRFDKYHVLKSNISTQ